MAITNNADANFVQNLLKVTYENKVESLLFRDDPVLNNIKKERVEGKSQHFAALYGRGGAVAGDFTKAEAEASKNTKSAEFQVTPGKLFSVYTMSSIEVQAAKTLRGAYMPIAEAKMFAATEAFRKTMAACLYGMGYGELCYIGLKASSAWTANDSKIIVIPEDAAMKIDIGSKLLLKAKITTAEASAVTGMTVTAIGSYGTFTVGTDDGVVNGTGAAGTGAVSGIPVTVTMASTLSSTAAAAEYVVSLAGSMNGTDPLLPIGLGGWLPILANRTGSTWATYAHTSFMGITRDEAVDRLAGAYYKPSASESKVATVEKLLRKARQQGSKADFIVMNDLDAMEIFKDIQTTNAYWTNTIGTDSKGKRSANVGYNDLRVNFMTSWIDKVYDSPFCPQGVFYILDSNDFRYWSYYNDAKMDNGIAGNEPGTPDPTSADSGIQNKPYQLMIDDFITVDGGKDTIDGPTARVTLNAAGSFIIKNPAHAAVGVFYGCEPIGSKLFA